MLFFSKISCPKLPIFLSLPKNTCSKTTPVTAEQAFSSTSRLSFCHTPESFYKYDLGWFELYSTRYFPPEVFTNPPSEHRKANALPPEDGGLKNKILIIHAKPSPTNKLSFWSSPYALTDKESQRLFEDDLARYARDIGH